MSGIANVQHVAKFFYDFATHGGAVGAVTLSGNPGLLPLNAIPTRVDVVTVTALAGSGATIAIGSTGTTEDFLAASAGAVANFDTALKSVGAALTSKAGRTTTNLRTPILTIGTNPLTAGQLEVYIHYLQPQNDVDAVA